METRRQPVPEFDQEKEYVVELPPEERDGYIFIGCEVREMEIEEETDLF